MIDTLLTSKIKKNSAQFFESDFSTSCRYIQIVYRKGVNNTFCKLKFGAFVDGCSPVRVAKCQSV